MGHQHDADVQKLSRAIATLFFRSKHTPLNFCNGIYVGRLNDMAILLIRSYRTVKESMANRLERNQIAVLDSHDRVKALKNIMCYISITPKTA